MKQSLLTITKSLNKSLNSCYFDEIIEVLKTSALLETTGGMATCLRGYRMIISKSLHGYIYLIHAIRIKHKFTVRRGLAKERASKQSRVGMVQSLFNAEVEL